MSVIQNYFDSHESNAWSVLCDLIPQLGAPPSPDQITFDSLFSSPLHEKLAVGFLQHYRASNRYSFLAPCQLHEMALGVERSERDIDGTAGVYIFLRLIDRNVLKVGQTNNLRLRIAKQHLLYGNQPSASNVVVYCKPVWDSGDYINEQDLAAFLFPMRGSCEEDRCIIEFGLQKLLNPEMK